MILVDTSAWIEFLRDTGSPVCTLVDELLAGEIAICDAVRGTLDHTPPELAADIMERGIMLAGGGALLRNLDQRMANETGMPITVAPDPLHAVVRGSGHVLENLEQLTGAVTTSGNS